MSIGNTKILTKDELYSFNVSYNVEVIDNNFIAINSVLRKVAVLHPINSWFRVFNKKIKRKIQISPTASKMWTEEFKNKYSIFEVQNAINVLTITYRDITKENVRKVLNSRN